MLDECFACDDEHCLCEQPLPEEFLKRKFANKKDNNSVTIGIDNCSNAKYNKG
jgi:hypothetical protein